MKKIIFIVLPIAALLIGISVTQAQILRDDCQGSVACESDVGLGENDTCCRCTGTEVLVDTDRNGFLDTCLDDGKARLSDPCTGQHDPTDVSLSCDNTVDACCRIPSSVSKTRMVRDPCHGWEQYTDTCVDGLKDDAPDACCVQKRARVQL